MTATLTMTALDAVLISLALAKEIRLRRALQDLVGRLIFRKQESNMNPTVMWLIAVTLTATVVMTLVRCSDGDAAARQELADFARPLSEACQGSGGDMAVCV